MPGIITWERYAKVSANVYWAALIATDLFMIATCTLPSTKLLTLELLQLRPYKTRDLRSKFLKEK